MRMDMRQAFTAADLVRTASESELVWFFRAFGEEPRARRIAAAIVAKRAESPLTGTRQLAELIERVAPRHGSRTHPATRVFQALRLAVNDELGSLQRGLQGLWSLLRPGGRMAVLTFHSLEARMVKDFGRELARGYTVMGDVDVPELRVEATPQLRHLTRHPLLPSAQEIAANPRARSAQLRVFERI
jgi:16S rRNA (cytosine1402-N4)-methyltransferase